MKIAFLYDDNNPHALARIKYFLKRGHEVYYYGLPPKGKHKVPEEVIHYSFTPNPILKRFKAMKYLQYILEARRFSRKHPVDVLHIMWMPFAIFAPFFFAKKFVFELLGCDILNYPRQNRFYNYLYPFCFRYAAGVTQGSRLAQEAGLRHGAPKENNLLIEVGIDMSLFNREVPKGRVLQRFGLSPQQKVIFSPRGFDDIYNIDTILRSIPAVKNHFPDVVYLFAPPSGEGGERFSPLIEELGVKDNVIFPGKIDKETELPFFYADADVMISVPSTDSSPQSVYEAMACGTPVIVSELPWYHQKFEKNKEVLTVAVRDVEVLAATIVETLQKEIFLDLEAAYRKVFEDINLEVENRKLEELYEHILCSRENHC